MHGILVAIAIACVWGSYNRDTFSQEVTLVGDETQLVRVKAEPRSYVEKRIVLTGAGTVSDYFNYGYADAESSHFSISFVEALKNFKLGDDIHGSFGGGAECTLYLLRESPLNQRVIPVLLEASPTHKVMRVTCTLLPFSENNLRWDMLELTDVQFLGPDGQWQDWIIQGDAQKQKAKEERAKLDKIMERRKVAAEARARADAFAETLWRTWTSADGTHRIQARIVHELDGRIALERRGGKRITVQLDRLSEQDQEYVRSKKWQRRK